MPTPVITTQPTAARRRARRVAALAGVALLTVLHLLVAALVLAVRVPYTLFGILARATARAELALSARTEREPLGQTAGVALAAAFATEFITSYKTATR